MDMTTLPNIAQSFENALLKAINLHGEIKIDEIRQIVREEVQRHQLLGTLSTKQAALYIGVHENTLYDMCAKGEIAYVPVRGKKRFRICSLDEWLESLEIKAKVALQKAE